METRTSKAFQLLDAGNFCQALAIFKTFRLGLTKDERRAIQITQEAEAGKKVFYEDLGINLEEERKSALAAINKLRA